MIHTVEIDHSLIIDMVRNNKFQFAAPKSEIDSMKVTQGDILMLDIQNYDTYYDTHRIELFIDGVGNSELDLKTMVFEVKSIVEIPHSSDVIVNIQVATGLGVDMPQVPEMKKSAGMPTDYL